MDVDVQSFVAHSAWLRIGAYLFFGPFLFGNLCSYLRARFDLEDGYSRKLHHIGIMLISAPCLAVLPDVQLLPSMMVASLALIALSFVAAYSRIPILTGMARHSLRRRDAPYSRFFFLMPMVTSNVAISVAALLFPLTLVKVAFFTVAVADGLAEPIGVRYGRSNTFSLPDPVWGWRNTKSLAGSFTVFAVASVVCYLILHLAVPSQPHIAIVCITYGLVAAIIEAFSPRGMDNMLIMLLMPPFLLSLGAMAW